MPYQWESPEIFLEHGGVTVYHCYTRHDMVSDIWYSVEATNTDTDYDLGDGTMFDVTDIPMPGGIDRLAWTNEQIIAYAIDRGWLTITGLTLPAADEYPETTPAPTVHLIVEDGIARIADKPAGVRVIISDFDPLSIGQDFSQIISEPDEQIKNGEQILGQ